MRRDTISAQIAVSIPDVNVTEGGDDHGARGARGTAAAGRAWPCLRAFGSGCSLAADAVEDSPGKNAVACLAGVCLAERSRAII